MTRLGTVFPSHGVGGMVGHALMTGIFAKDVGLNVCARGPFFLVARGAP